MGNLAQRASQASRRENWSDDDVSNFKFEEHKNNEMSWYTKVAK